MSDAPPSKPVLIVEDNEDVRMALSILLEHHGYETAVADNGAVALSLLQHGAVEPCLILLDLDMPVMNGAEFRRAQRADSRLANVPVVIYSGTDDVRQEARALDVPHYFQKP